MTAQMTDKMDLVLDAVHYATYCGMISLDKEGHVAPPSFALFPSPIPRSERDFVASIQKDVSRLIDRSSRDRDFLHGSLRNAAVSDEFTRELLKISEKTWESSQKKPVLELLRSDYLLDSTDRGRATRARQIEVNVIASSCSNFSEKLPHLHRFTLSRRDGKKPFDFRETLPDNHANDGFIDALALSWKAYNSSSSIIITVMNRNERNIYELLSIRYGLLKRHGIENRLICFDDMIEGGPMEAKLHSDDQALLIDGQEVAVVFFRSCYGVEHYPTEKHWKARLLLETSKSIQCPSVAQQLAGTKKIQQELSKPGILEKFIEDPAAVRRMRATFCAMYSIDRNAEGDAAAQLGVQNPEQYVLKPQREGGGHNIYGIDVKTFLEKHWEDDERSAYIMMERVRPSFADNYFVRQGQITRLQPTQLINELGIYGAYVRKGEEELLNEAVGHVLRSKPFDSDEGGLFAGYGCLDSPLFT
ncbi:glutathione synthetase-like [Oscarella lobularis]|uniref:glutathione synthetase-like n=1 Tax=Oscarella lobularis TaxID=121494 RepID=UPI003313C566